MSERKFTELLTSNELQWGDVSRDGGRRAISKKLAKTKVSACEATQGVGSACLLCKLTLSSGGVRAEHRCG